MQLVADRLVFSPTDLTHFLACEYLSRLEIEVANGRVFEKYRAAEADLLAAKGEAYERAHLGEFERRGLRTLRIGETGNQFDWDVNARETQAAMLAGLDVIYQAVLLDQEWRGKADFLVKVDTRSALGDWSYEAWDAKLARHAQPSHLLQLAYYSERLAALQGRGPEWMHLFLGTGEQVRFRYRDFCSYYHAVRRRFERAAREKTEVAPYPVAHCRLCGYISHCEEGWEAADHLSLVAAIRRSQVERLIEADVRTSAGLVDHSGAVAGIGPAALDRLRHQARLQTHFRNTGEHRYELLALTGENGFRLLPKPSDGDVFFDMEGFPFFAADAGLEYLFGTVTAEDGHARFQAFRAIDRDSEKRAFEEFVDFVWDRLRRWPDLHIYHYSHYEPTALKRLMTTHATREDEIDELLRREAFVDLYQVVRRSLRISHKNYSIKAVRHFFMPDAGKGPVADGGQSIVEFQRWLDTGDARVLDEIERYNEEDCLSTLKLREWLLERRREAQDSFGIEIAFRQLPDQRDNPVEIEPDEHADLRRRLAVMEQPWTTTLGHLLDYHRREAKPEWWTYFERRKKPLDELLEDTEAIAYLTPAREPAVAKARSLVHALEFPPQEFKLKVDREVDGPFGEGRAGTIEWLDGRRGRLGLRRGREKSGDPLPVAIIAGGPVPDKAQRAAIVRVADAAARGRSSYRAVEDILRGVPPRFRTTPSGVIQTLDLEAQKQLVADLDSSYLFIQGPPGSGKTWAGARLIVTLLKAGSRVGVTGPSHRAIHNLLEGVERVATEARVDFVGIKKRSTSDETAFDGRFISSVDSNEECEQSEAQLVAGTSWLFARDRMDQSFDYLFIDEAGQTALADAVAVGTASRNIILLGDPQQLPHVTQNSHPEGAGCSVLEHLLGDAATVSDDRGLFLAQSWRMHPEVCRFVSELSYDGRLVSAPGCELQQVKSSGLTGVGLRYLPIEHRHNAQQAPEEAVAIAREVSRLLDGNGTVTNRDGTTRPLVATDVLVVAPYNMQVRCLHEALPANVEVGTVDKFQGREAAVVFFSMTSSSGDDVPRGLEFLFNQNRFNVAVSRAKCLSVVVCSPRLLETQCRTVPQMKLVNGVCRFAEAASRW
jgi:predicted RecB family nuclease